jgi:hypothetical protein
LSPCSQLRDEIDAANEDLQGYINRYEGWKAKGDATSGHLEAIKGQQNRLRRLERRYSRNEKCQDDDDHDDWDGWGTLQSLAAYVPPPFDRDFSHGYTPRNYEGATQNNPILLPQLTVTAEKAAAMSAVLILLLVILLAPVGA